MSHMATQNGQAILHVVVVIICAIESLSGLHGKLKFSTEHLHLLVRERERERESAALA